MSKEPYMYSKGDWVVHLYYGVGQIEKIEKKTISENTTLYYRVATDNGTFWLPVKNANCDRVRPLATPGEMKAALNILKRKPRKMESDYKDRQKQIKKAQSDGSLHALCRIIRDLIARQKLKKLTTLEQKALDNFTDRLLKEWCLSMNIGQSDARQNLFKMVSVEVAN